jgi:hypothetical protein
VGSGLQVPSPQSPVSSLEPDLRSDSGLESSAFRLPSCVWRLASGVFRLGSGVWRLPVCLASGVRRAASTLLNLHEHRGTNAVWRK